MIKINIWIVLDANFRDFISKVLLLPKNVSRFIWYCEANIYFVICIISFKVSVLLQP